MAKADLHVLYVDCFKFYVDSMQTSIRENDPFFTDSEMERIHETTKSAALKKVFYYIQMALLWIFRANFIGFR